MSRWNVSVSTHSRLKAAGFGDVRHVAGGQVSTHSRLKAAGWQMALERLDFCAFQHTAA